MQELKKDEILIIMANCSGNDGDLLGEWMENFYRGLLPYEGEWLPTDTIKALPRRRSLSRLGLVEVWAFFGVIIVIELGLLLLVRGLHS